MSFGRFHPPEVLSIRVKLAGHKYRERNRNRDIPQTETWEDEATVTRAELLQKMDEVKFALQEYKRQGLDKSVVADELTDIQKIKQSALELVVEIRLINASSRMCPKCYGTGKV